MHRRFEQRIDRQLNITKNHFDQQDKELDELTEKIRETRQLLAGLEQDSRQPRVPKEADVKLDTKTRNRTEDTAAE